MRFFDKEDSSVNCRHIDVLDGIRALAILIVVWLHIWEQDWLMPIINTPALSFLGINQINVEWIPRTGFMIVNLIIFISGFCLYLPYARHTVYNEPLPELKTFIRKRIARIIPSYVFCVLAIFIYNIFTASYTAPDYAMSGDSMFMWKDLLTRLTFTFNLIPSIGTQTLLNGALWTVALEVQFYIFFPFLAKAFLKKPVITYSTMTLISFAFIFWINMINPNEAYLPQMHQLPAYLSIYANGFLGALLFTKMTNSVKRKKYIAILSTLTSVVCIYIYSLIMNSLKYELNTKQNWQINSRYFFSLLFIVFVIATAYSLPFYRKIFSNKIAVFFSTISFNLYMWHQFLGGAFKKHKIPYYPDNPEGLYPNELGDKSWMLGHFISSIVVSIIIATLVTYFLEKPMSKLILKKKQKQTTSHQKKPVRRKGLSSK